MKHILSAITGLAAFSLSNCSYHEHEVVHPVPTTTTVETHRVAAPGSMVAPTTTLGTTTTETTVIR